MLSENGNEHRVDYVPGDSTSGSFGGNSNWRGPVWMPVNFLLYGALHRLHAYFGDRFKIECPTGSGRQMTLFEVGQELGRRLASLFLRGPDGQKAGPRPRHEVPFRPAMARPDPLLRVLPR